MWWTAQKERRLIDFFFSSIFVGGLMGGYKMCSYFLVFDMQLLAAISDTFQRATQRIASKTGIKCSRLTWMSLTFILLRHPYGIQYVRYIVFEFTRYILTHDHIQAEIKYVVHLIGDQPTLKSTNTVRSVERDVTQVPCLKFN